MDSGSDTIHMGETYGGMMVGLLLASILCGIASVQALIFFCAKRTDPLSHKLSVAFLWIMDVLQLCFVFSATYFYVVDHPGITSPPFIWNFKIQIFMQVSSVDANYLMFLSLTKCCHQRVSDFDPELDKNDVHSPPVETKHTSKWLPIGVMVFLVADYGLGTAFAYEVFTVPTLPDLLHISFKPLIMAWMCTTTASDFLVGGALIYTIVKSHPSLSWTNSDWTMLIAYLVNTGIITGIFSAAALIAFIVGVQTSVFILFEIALPQFYVNCFFSMLNASVYFKTNHNWNASPTTTHLLTYFHDDESISPERASLSGDVTASSPLVSRSFSTILKSSQSEIEAPTINEIGLPLFPLEPKPEPVVRNVPLQVKVSVQTKKTVASENHTRRGRAVAFRPST
ncbi:hypothetical protein BT96DRAFT_1005079 [Gymnopus androsaceus JB14]|uniref:DUF6534 domain-containing protein n=1 Tax=Gymnopus androsaceus JB14 TaxID=1447944 RepID=A0A6A4GNU8_9AGAR|nr:hypothetical protein BT96DRAFT_1005079 [Gymnopus androsaceus JB14]